jgi:transglutaminase-like putative cysteine protease
MVIAAAVLVPGLLPGFRSGPLVDLSTTGDEGAGLDPFISIHAQLDEQEVRDLFEVQSPKGQYWRLYTLDVFDGEEWRSSDPRGDEDGVSLSTPASPLPQDPRYTYPPDAPSIPQTFRILSDFDTGGGLPMAQSPEGIVGPLGDITWDPYRGQAFVDGGQLDAGLEYTVTSRIVVPKPEELDRVVDLTPMQYGRWTDLPEDALDPRIEEIANGWTEGAISDYDKVLAIQRHFHSDGFQYSTDVEVNDSADALLAFLTQTKAGFCQQYATAMAVLVRELGIPARIAVGYQAGTLQDDETYLVQTRDAHAWVEVFFEGYGWLQFEPTPGHGTHPNAQAGTYLNPVTQSDGQGGQVDGRGEPIGPGRGGAAECLTSGSPSERQLACKTEFLLVPGLVPGSESGFGRLPPFGATDTPDRSRYSVPYRLILLGSLAVLGVLLIVVPIAKSAWRRRLLRRSREPREHVLAAYRVFDGEAADLGLGRREGETLDEHRARLAAAIAFTNGHLGRLTSLATRAAYASEAPTREEANASVDDARKAIRELRRDAGIIRRIVGTYRPGL